MSGSGSRLRERLRERRSEIGERWLECVLETYPDDSARFIRDEKDPFANPVGHTLRTELSNVLDELLFEEGRERLAEFLERVIRIRAVQDFSPAAAIAFVFDLKAILREELLPVVEREGLLDELFRLEVRLDEAALIAFNVYSKCREELARLRVEEVKRNVHNLLRRAGMLMEPAEEAGEIQ